MAVLAAYAASGLIYVEEAPVGGIGALWGNASVQEQHITGLWANASVQEQHINELWANASHQDSRIISLEAFGVNLVPFWVDEGGYITSNVSINAGNVHVTGNLTVGETNFTGFFLNGTSAEITHMTLDVISVTRNLSVSSLRGVGDAFVCCDENGTLYRSATVCVV